MCERQNDGCSLDIQIWKFYCGSESQAGVKIPGRYADGTTVLAESEDELKSLLMGVKEESEKPGLIFNIQKTKIMACSPITSW